MGKNGKMEERWHFQEEIKYFAYPVSAKRMKEI